MRGVSLISNCKHAEEGAATEDIPSDLKKPESDTRRDTYFNMSIFLVMT